LSLSLCCDIKMFPSSKYFFIKTGDSVLISSPLSFTSFSLIYSSLHKQGTEVRFLPGLVSILLFYNDYTMVFHFFTDSIFLIILPQKEEL